MKLQGYEERHVGQERFFFLPLLEEKGIIHGFSTRLDCPPSLIFAETPYILMEQRHSDTIHLIRQGERPESGDGLVILEKGVFGVVKTADCLPIIMAEPSVPVTAILHAGWRGTLRGITRKAVNLLKAIGGETITVLFGPAIGPCCYEVKEDLRDLFSASGFPEEVFEERGGRLFFDLKKANLLQLDCRCDVYDLPLCTYCESRFFSSARRGDRGRQISFAGLRP